MSQPVTSPRLVLHHPSLQASRTALLPPMPAGTPLRYLLRTAGQHTKESLSRLKSSVGSGLQTRSSLVAPVPLQDSRFTSHSFSVCCCFFHMRLIWKPASPRLSASSASSCGFSAAAFPHSSVGPAVGGRGGWGVFSQQVYQTMRCPAFRRGCTGSFALT